MPKEVSCGLRTSAAEAGAERKSPRPQRVRGGWKGVGWCSGSLEWGRASSITVGVILSALAQGRCQLDRDRRKLVANEVGGHIAEVRFGLSKSLYRLRLECNELKKSNSVAPRCP